MTERMMRGGLSSVFSSRQEVANNIMLPYFDESKDVSSIIYIDANNLYGVIMLQYSLPLKDFELVEDISLEKILQTKNEGDIGFLVEVDLEYSDELHDKHADYPLVPDKEPIDPLEPINPLSNFSKKHPQIDCIKNQKAETDLPSQEKLCDPLS